MASSSPASAGLAHGSVFAFAYGARARARFGWPRPWLAVVERGGGSRLLARGLVC